MTALRIDELAVPGNRVRLLIYAGGTLIGTLTTDEQVADALYERLATDALRSTLLEYLSTLKVQRDELGICTECGSEEDEHLPGCLHWRTNERRNRVRRLLDSFERTPVLWQRRG